MADRGNPVGVGVKPVEFGAKITSAPLTVTTDNSKPATVARMKWMHRTTPRSLRGVVTVLVTASLGGGVSVVGADMDTDTDRKGSELH